MKIKLRQKNLGTYLAITAGAGCATSVVNAGVIFYGVNSANDTNADPLGVDISYVTDVFYPYYSYGFIEQPETYQSVFASDVMGIMFTNGVDISTVSGGDAAGFYLSYTGFNSGATMGDQNYVNVSFDGDDGIYEAVGQFYFDGTGGGYLIAIATNNDASDPSDLSNGGGTALSISEGKAMIYPASVPEPSSIALLALGATGLLARRRRVA